MPDEAWNWPKHTNGVSCALEWHACMWCYRNSILYYNGTSPSLESAVAPRCKFSLASGVVDVSTGECRLCYSRPFS